MKTIYGLECPVINKIRYVGYTGDVNKRYKEHLCDLKNTAKVAWINELKEKGLLPKLVILETVEHDDYFKAERDWIARHSSDVLTNINERDWVEGSDYTQSKQKILEAIKQNPNASYRDIAKACGLSRTNVYHHIQGLIESGKIRHGFKWEVL